MPESARPVFPATDVVEPAVHGRTAGHDRVPRPVLSELDVARTIDRIAHQIIERLAGSTDAALLGIPTRGAPLARRLADRVAAFGGGDLGVGVLDITLFRDDLRRGGMRPLAETLEPPGGVDGKLVVLVDDVLFSGRTIRAALDALTQLGRPRAVQLAVLIERSATVRVHLAEVDGEDSVYVSSGDR